MNIESKVWKAQQYGQWVSITHKPSRQEKTVPIADVPGPNALAMMSESAFDKTMRDLFHDA